MDTALNGNIKSATDPDFVHFTDEQSGIILPSIPGYPFWLPQLQLTPTGRLCFWNFPYTIFQSVVSNPANAGTFDFLIDAKYASQQGKMSVGGQFSNGGEKIGIRNNLVTNGTNGDYFWQDTATFSWFTADSAALIKGLMSIPVIFSSLPNVSGYVAGRQANIGPTQWIFLNIQYYICKYLNVPYNVYDLVPYTDSWVRKFNLAHDDGSFSKYLGGCNFLVQPTGGPTFWDKVIQAAPVIISAAVSIVSLGAAAPSFIAALASMAGGVASKGIAAQNNQGIAINNARAQGQTINTNQITSDVSEYTGIWYNLTDNQKKFAFVSLAVLILLFILMYKSK